MRRGRREAEEGEMNITGAQLKAARKLLGWSAIKTAIQSNVAPFLIGAFERGQRDLAPEAVSRLTTVLKAAGVEFTNGGEPGVKLRKGAKGASRPTKPETRVGCSAGPSRSLRANRD
jgi:transcriptional regulator with XRE-family HTH domain